MVDSSQTLLVFSFQVSALQQELQNAARSQATEEDHVRHTATLKAQEGVRRRTSPIVPFPDLFRKGKRSGNGTTSPVCHSAGSWGRNIEKRVSLVFMTNPKAQG